VAVVINDFEVTPGGDEASRDSGQQTEQKGAPAGHEVEKEIAEWMRRHKERSLRNWAH